MQASSMFSVLVNSWWVAHADDDILRESLTPQTPRYICDVILPLSSLRIEKQYIFIRQSQSQHQSILALARHYYNQEDVSSSSFDD